MALEVISEIFGRALTLLYGVGNGRLRNILVELQGLTPAVVAGAGVDTNIAIAGIALEDTILLVMRLNRDGTAGNIDISDVTSEASITSAGNIQLNATDTSGDSLLVFFFNKTP